MAYDQHDAAARPVALAVSRSIPVRRFMGPALATAIDSPLQSQAVAAQCRTIADRIHQELPVGRSVRLIEKNLKQNISVCCRGARF